MAPVQGVGTSLSFRPLPWKETPELLAPPPPTWQLLPSHQCGHRDTAPQKGPRHLLGFSGSPHDSAPGTFSLATAQQRHPSARTVSGVPGKRLVTPPAPVMTWAPSERIDNSSNNIGHG